MSHGRDCGEGKGQSSPGRAQLPVIPIAAQRYSVCTAAATAVLDSGGVCGRVAEVFEADILH